MIHRDDPTSAEQIRLLQDPEARAERRAWRKEALPPPGKDVRSRRRTAIDEAKTLALSMPSREVSLPVIRALDEALRGKQPIFDQFTQHHRIKPTARAIEAYVNGGSNRGPNDKRRGPKPITDFPP